MELEAAIREKFRSLASRLDEHTRRIWAATEARAQEYGGTSLVARADLHFPACDLGRAARDREREYPAGGPSRWPGGGRKSGVAHQPELPAQLQGLVEPLTRGDPESPLRWTCKSTRRLSRELATLG